MRGAKTALALLTATTLLIGQSSASAQAPIASSANPGAVHYRTCALGIVDVEARQIIVPYGTWPHDNPYYVGMLEVCATGGFDGTNVYFYPLPEQVRLTPDANGENRLEPTGVYCGRFGTAIVATREADWLARLDDFMAERQAQCEAGNRLFCGGMMFVARTEPVPPANIACPVGP